VAHEWRKPVEIQDKLNWYLSFDPTDSNRPNLARRVQVPVMPR